MPARAKHRIWRLCRIYFRRFRITVWLILLIVICGLVYLDLVGLPDFVKNPLLNSLHDRGLDLRISRLRLRWPHGIVADQVRFGSTENTSGPTFSAEEASLQLNLRALTRFRLQVDALDLRHGKLEWPDDGTSLSLKVLNVENIETTLRLLPGDEWLLDDLRARFAGANFTCSADITNASAIRNWKVLQPSQPTPTNTWPQRLRLLANTVRTISFSVPPEMRLVVNGDALDLNRFSALLTVNSPDANTPWAQANGVLLIVRLLPQTDNDLAHAELNFEAATVQTKWGTADALNVNALATHSTNSTAASGLTAWWTNAALWDLSWSSQFADVRTEKLTAERIICAGEWTAPSLTVTNLKASLGDGTVYAQVGLDAKSRELWFSLTSDADPDDIENILTPKTRDWLSEFSWASPPRLGGSGKVTLPEWTNLNPDWRREVLPTLCLAGEFAATNAAYRGVSVDWARSHFSYTNRVWRLPDLQVHRPEGTLQFAHEQDERSKDFHWHVRGPIDPQALRPLLTSNQLHGLDIITFEQPPVVEGDVWGRLHDYDRIGFQMHAAMTNFSVRGKNADTFESDVLYTNRCLEFIEPNLTRGAQHMKADGVTVDFNSERIYFTNGFGMAEPQVVADAIGPEPGATLEPYHFVFPPVARVEGYAPLRGSTDADLHFAVEGGPFEWSKFKVPHITGDVYWLRNTVLLTNVQMDFYEGYGAGFAFFTFEPGQPGSDFNFSLSVSNANLQLLMADVSTHSNRLEGTLSGSLQITDANSTNWQSWNGLGQARLRDGFLWEVPFFGVLSPALDSFAPGLGSSRATDARAGFVITNGVVYSDSLNIRTPMTQLKYDGTVDFDGRVNARVEAELLRESGFVRRVFNAALGPVMKLFEYKVTGTISDPNAEPVYFVPRLIFFPFRPIRTFQDLFSGGNKTTNAPPVWDQSPEQR